MSRSILATTRRWFLLVLACASAAFTASAAPAQGGPNRFDLAALIRIAMENNLSLAADQAAIAASTEGVAAARGARLPHVDAVGLAEVFPRRERLLLFRHGFRGNDNPFENVIANYGMELTLPLYTSGRIEHGISLAEARVEVQRSRSQLSRQQLVFNVTSAYYTGLRLKEVVTAQNAVLASLEEALRVGELQQKVGRLAPLDLLRLKTRVAQGQRDLAGAHNQYEQALEVVRELVFLPPEEAIVIKGSLRAADTTTSAPASREQALAMRPDLQKLRHEVNARREAIGIAGAALGPSVHLKASYRGVTGIDNGVTKDDGALLLQFRVPIFDGGVLDARKRKALAELNEAQLRLRAAERRAFSDVDRSILDLRAAGPRITAARLAVAQGEESLRVERKKFAQGRGTSNDLLLAEEALLRARTELALALADSQIAAARLRLATGNNPGSDPAPGTYSGGTSN